MAGLVAAMIPAAALVLKSGHDLPLLALCAAIPLIWHILFAKIRHHPMAWNGVASGLVFAVLAPEGLPLWQAAFALSFGLVTGEHLFGARGRGFLSPVTVSLAFLLFAYPQEPPSGIGPISPWAVAASGALLLAFGLLSWRVVVGFGAGFAAVVALWGIPAEWNPMPASMILTGLVFLVGDPVAVASTARARWVYGAIAGGLVVLFSLTGGGALSSMVFAALLASLFAPLLDQAVIWTNVRSRARRQPE